MKNAAVLCLIFLVASLNGAPLLKSTEKPDSTKVRELQQRIAELHPSNLLLEFTLLHQADSICVANLQSRLNDVEVAFFNAQHCHLNSDLAYNSFLREQFMDAIQYASLSLKLAESLGDVTYIMRAETDLGSIHHFQENYGDALLHFKRVLRLATRSNNTYSKAIAHNNLGNIYMSSLNYEDALDHYLKCKELLINDSIPRPIIGRLLSNIGNTYLEMDQPDMAEEVLLAAQSKHAESGDEYAQSISLSNLARVYSDQGKIKAAIRTHQKALVIAQKLNYTQGISEAAQGLYECYDKSGQFKQALHMHELYVSSKDSLLKEENHRELMRQEFKYAYERQAQADSLSHYNTQLSLSQKLADSQSQIQEHDAVSKKGRRGFYLLLIAMMALLLLGAFLIRRKRNNSKKNNHA